MANKKTSDASDYPTLSSLLSQSYYKGSDSLAAYCYRYIKNNLFSYVTEDGLVTGTFDYDNRISKEQLEKMKETRMISSVYSKTRRFTAELRKQMACFIIDHGLQDKEIDWPEPKIRIDTLHTDESGLSEYLEKRYYVDLLDTTLEVVNDLTPLEAKVAEDEKAIRNLKEEQGSLIGHIFGWLIVLLLGLNTAGSVMALFYSTDLQAKLLDVCCNGLMRWNLPTFAKIMNVVIKNVMISGDVAIKFGRSHILSWVIFIVTAGLFLIVLVCMTASAHDRIHLGPSRKEKLRTLKEEVRSIRASGEYRAETERRKAILAVYPKMIKGLKAAGRKK
ncbi:MAG: hypothetical protein IIY44_00540 [Erysipelotrichales bacterium]|nr:hypothetical protein [Erysipelotrichales bacterium]